MRLFSALALATAMATLPAATAADQQTVYDYLKSADNLTILLSAVTEAGQASRLKAKEPHLTLFAPTDDAWKKLGDADLRTLVADKEKLAKIVSAHIELEKVLGSKELEGLNGKPVNGFTISTVDGLKIGPAKVIMKDVKCSNGVIHLIDVVLIPK